MKTFTNKKVTLKIPPIGYHTSMTTYKHMQIFDCNNACCGRDGDNCLSVDCSKCIYDPAHIATYVEWIDTVNKI